MHYILHACTHAHMHTCIPTRLRYPYVQASLIAYHERMEAVVLEKAAKMEEIGGEAYLKEMSE